MSKMSIAELLGGTSDDDDTSDFVKLAADVEELRLRESYAAFSETHTFRPGMIVRQKKLASGYRNHGENDLGIVVEVLAVPLYCDSREHGSPYWHKPMDMILGHLTVRKDGADTFDLYHVDSRHYEPYPE